MMSLKKGIHINISLVPYRDWKVDLLQISTLRGVLRRFCIAILYSDNEGQRSYAKLNVQTEVKFAVRSVRIFHMPYTGYALFFKKKKNIYIYKCIHAQSIRFPCTAYGIFERTVNPLSVSFIPLVVESIGVTE